MPRRCEVSYSLEETVAAIRDYFEFLTKMYLDESCLQLPPEGGWPEITPERLRPLGKTDDVVQLLRHIPYLDDSHGRKIYAGPCNIEFYKWPDRIRRTIRSGHDPAEAFKDFEDMRIITEPYEDWDKGLVPPHVVGLIIVESWYERFLLDTKHGIIYWYYCPHGIRHNPTREPILDDTSDSEASEESSSSTAIQEQGEWRTYPAWPVKDFFELLKDCLRNLQTVPLSSDNVYDLENHDHFQDKVVDTMPLIKEVFWKHGWPNLELYRKEECLREVNQLVQEKCPEEYL